MRLRIENNRAEIVTGQGEILDSFTVTGLGEYETTVALYKEAKKRGYQVDYGRDYFVASGKIGGNRTKERHGADHFSKVGKKGMEKRWKS